MEILNKIEDEIRFMEGGKFQKFCDSYLYQKYGWNINTPGSMDGTNKTTAGTPDSYVYDQKNDNYTLIMYGTHKNPYDKLMSDIKDAKEKTNLSSDKIKEIVCCYAGSNISIDKNNKLVNEAKPYPLYVFSSTDIALDLINNYYILAERFFNLPSWTGQINTYDNFINKHDMSNINAPLSTTYIDQNNRLDKLICSIKNNQLTVIAGQPGVGKTKSAIESMKTIANKSSHNQCLFIKSNQMSFYQELINCISESKMNYILLDDANEFNNLKGVISILQQYKNVHFIITIRSYEVDNIRNIILEYKHQMFNIESSNFDTIDSILKEKNYFPNNSNIRTKIIKSSHFNPRHAVIASYLIKNNGLKYSNNLKEIMIYYYKNIVDNAEISNSCLKTLFVISVFNKTSFVKRKYLHKILCLVDLDYKEFLDDIFNLKNKEICNVFHNEIVSIEDQTFRDYILNLFFFNNPNFDLQEFFYVMFEYGLNLLVDSLNNAMSISFDKEKFYKLKNTIINFYENYKEKLNEKENIEVLKKFGTYLDTDVTDAVMKLVHKSPNQKIDFNLDFNNYNKINNKKNDDIFILLNNLLLNDFRYYKIVINQCMELLQKNQYEIKNVVSFLSDHFGIDNSLGDPFNNIKIIIPILIHWSNESIKIVDECIFFLVYDLLKTNVTKTKFNSDNTISTINYNINDSNVDMKVRDKLFSILSILFNNNCISKYLLIDLFNNTLSNNNQCNNIMYSSLNHLIDISINSKANISKSIINIMKVEYFRIQYLMNNYSLKEIMNNFNEFQKFYWTINNYSLKKISERIHRKDNLEYLSQVAISRFDDFLYYIDLLFKNKFFGNKFLIYQNSFYVIRKTNGQCKNKILKLIFNNGFYNLNDFYITSYISIYGVKNFINDFSQKYNKNFRVLYLAYSILDNPSSTDSSLFYNCLNKMSINDWNAVSLDGITNYYQKNNFVDLFLHKTMEFSSYNDFICINKEISKMIFYNVSDKDILFKCYIKGLEYGIDYDNCLFCLIKDNFKFQEMLINYLFDENIYWNSVEIFSKISLLFKSNHFKEMLKKKLFDNNVLYSRFNNGWDAIFQQPNDLIINWLFNCLKESKEYNINIRIIDFINVYLNQKQSLPFFKILKEKGVSLKDFNVLPLNSFIQGSNVPYIENNLLFLSKLMEIFDDDTINYQVLKKLDQYLKSEIERTKIYEYLWSI
ncbi:DnaB-like helicase C-terminal domain-containing protein [Apilactobacillus micheneri]|uniref:DnaB-like helicase C-terminal domain-containing protein n=1 Tax=Apilactobacillus micheneri TaxID=1899430 RepID=UPI000D510413|nr:DnaB-like helicase C-terminal domain-containing protein [Apilactobacillus micheneri]GAY79925.1 hypothetical protein NBRC113063_00789 [Apilactobacillus micheneri]